MAYNIGVANFVRTWCSTWHGVISPCSGHWVETLFVFGLVVLFFLFLFFFFGFSCVVMAGLVWQGEPTPYPHHFRHKHTLQQTCDQHVPWIAYLLSGSEHIYCILDLEDKVHSIMGFVHKRPSRMRTQVFFLHKSDMTDHVSQSSSINDRVFFGDRPRGSRSRL